MQQTDGIPSSTQYAFPSSDAVRIQRGSHFSVVSATLRDRLARYGSVWRPIEAAQAATNASLHVPGETDPHLG